LTELLKGEPRGYKDQYIGRTEQDLETVKASGGKKVVNDGLTVSNWVIILVCVILTMMSEGKAM
jgi:hypothetical protein